MEERTRVVLSGLVGAGLGLLVGYLYFTGSGRRLLEQAEPRLDGFLHELGRLKGTLLKAQAVANEGLKSLHDLAGDRGQQWGSSSARQSSPF